jgi:hypothetical protein
VYWRSNDRLISTLTAHFMQPQCIHNADYMHTKNN